MRPPRLPAPPGGLLLPAEGDQQLPVSGLPPFPHLWSPHTAPSLSSFLLPEQGAGAAQGLKRAPLLTSLISLTSLTSPKSLTSLTSKLTWISTQGQALDTWVES